MNEIYIRYALSKDANAISRVIIQTLREVNIKDYSSTIIDKVVNNFSPMHIDQHMNSRKIYVAINQNEIVGTASLENNMIRSVFILPNKQKNGIGLMLVNHLEKIAKEQNIRCLTVSSSLTAENFYGKLGYKVLRYAYHGEERTAIMEKNF